MEVGTMRRLLGIAMLAICPLGLVGCGGASKETPAAQQSAAANQTGGATADAPNVAVFQFLEAVRTGDDQKAAEMLTKLARQKTEEMEMVVAPPGSATAKFEVGEVEMIQDAGAYVSSTWTDLDEQGQPHSDQIVWVLRKEPEGWRIAGMVTRLFDNKLVLNFEDPEDMLRKQQLAEQEMIKRTQQDAPQGEPSGQPPIGQQPVGQQPIGQQPVGTQAQQPGGATPLR
jgi:hypothetical protein